MNSEHLAMAYSYCGTGLIFGAAPGVLTGNVPSLSMVYLGAGFLAISIYLLTREDKENRGQKEVNQTTDRP